MAATQRRRDRPAPRGLDTSDVPSTTRNEKTTCISQPKPSAQKTISQPKPTTQKAVPPKKAFTNGLFRPLTDQQIDMLEREYYTNKNMVGRDKLYFILKRKYGDKASTQKAINDWLINQKTHQLHRRQFKSQTITPIKNVRVPNQMYVAWNSRLLF